MVRGPPDLRQRGPAARAVRGRHVSGGPPVHRAAAQQTAEFLLKTTYDGDHFSFVGSNGWYEQGKTRATFDQQPIDAAAMVMMLRAAYDASKDPRYLTLQRTAFDWFLGANDLHVAAV